MKAVTAIHVIRYGGTDLLGLISGLEKGEWVVERNGKSLGKFSVGEADGTIYLNAAPGKYLVRR